ncbi:MAG: hypothetical protein QOH43_2559, partial [Solirubrobacteraceae bacterium]|nr:hypothetical protein [Solirubrobacteraceae bacterium]
MRTPFSRRRVRAAVFLSPLVVAAVLAPSSALAAPPQIVSLTGPTSVTDAGSATYTATATDPDDGANLLTPGANLKYSWALDGIPVSGNGDGTGTSSVTVTPPHGPSTIAVTVTAGPVGLETADEPSAPSSLGILANQKPNVPSITVPPVKAGVPVTLTANATDPDSDPIVGYTWNLGDNVPQNTTGNTITTTFAPGTYTVWVNPHDSLGAESSGPSPQFTVANQPPRAKLTVSPNPVGIGKTVNLSGVGSI